MIDLASRQKGLSGVLHVYVTLTRSGDVTVFVFFTKASYILVMDPISAVSYVPGAVFSCKVRYIVGSGLGEMVISTSAKPIRYIITCTRINTYHERA